MLEKLVITRDCPKDYLYYQTPNPWLQVKLLKLIQKLPFPENGSDANSKLMVILQKII
jgi:AP-2 complex subunit alpha